MKVIERTTQIGLKSGGLSINDIRAEFAVSFGCGCSCVGRYHSDNTQGFYLANKYSGSVQRFRHRPFLKHFSHT